jgi:tetratricopeptide (TPR) repeat protein
LEVARRANRPEFEVYGHVGRVSLCLQACDREGADASGAHIERLAREHTIGDIPILRALWRGLVAQLEGRLDDAEREAQENLQLSRRFNYQPERATALVAQQHWWLSLLRGRPLATFSVLRSYTSDQPNLRPPRFLLARLYAELGHREDALRELQLLDARALEQLPRDHSWLFNACLSAEICALLDDSKRARDIYELLHPYAELAATTAYIGTCIGSVARSLGALAATLGMWPECEELFDLALASNEALQAPALVVWTQIDYARVLLRDPRPRQRAKGQRMLELAARAAAPLGMSDALARARPAL